MSSSFGTVLKLQLFGESHGPAVGMCLDGFPAGFRPDLTALQTFLDRRAPGRSALTSARREADRPEFLSGLADGLTCGAPLTAVLPNGDAGVMLIDCGANADCTPEYLLQFAYMGSYYARTMLGIAAPRVGLLSNGTEEHKGAELQHETFPLLKAADADGRIRFIGNVEASQVFNGDVDVVVTDGFTGNVLLKGIEGSIKYMTRQLKGIFMKNFKTKLAALAIKDEFKALKASLDPNEVGGTAMLGISKPVIKAHGSSDARAIYNAIRQAISFVDSGIIDDITANISYMRVDKHAAKECD